MAPLRFGGLRGKKSTPSVGWEVPVKSHRLESESDMERMGQQLREDNLGYGTLIFIMHSRLLLYFTPLILYFYLVKGNVDLSYQPRT